MTQGADTAHTPRGRLVLFVALLAGGLVLAGLLALGTWQVRRLAWKQDLIARVTRQQVAPPVAAPAPADWPALNRNADEYRRLQLQGEFDHSRETLVRASTEYGTGYWVLTPLRTRQGFWLLVNRGYVPPEFRSRESRLATEPQGPQVLTGLLRLTEPKGSLLQANEPAAGRWYSRDVQAIAAARGLNGLVAPYFVDQALPPGAAGADGTPETWPRAGLTVLNFSNNHLVYAATWFTLAAMLAAALIWLSRRAWQRQLPAATTAHAAPDPAADRRG